MRRLDAAIGSVVALAIIGAFAFGAILATAIPAHATPVASSLSYDNQPVSITMGASNIRATVTISGPRKSVEYVINMYEGSQGGWEPSVYQAPLHICTKQHQYGTSIEVRDTSRDPKSWGRLACGY